MKRPDFGTTLRIAHLTPTFFAPESVLGGGERYVDYLARSLARVSDFEQCVFAIGPDDRLFERGGVPIRTLRNESPLPGAMDGCSAALWRELPGFDVAHIHQCLTGFGAYATAIVRSLGMPAVGTDLGGGEDPLMLGQRGLGLLDGVLSISRYAHDLIDTAVAGRHEVLVGPVDTDRFTPHPSRARDPSLVLCVGRIMPHKGIDRVIDALPPGLQLAVAGRVYDDAYFAQLRRMAAGRRVTFVHDADDDRLVDLYRSAAVFVQASTDRDLHGTRVHKPELMGLTTLEALACGLPAVVSDAGSLPELAADRRFARVFGTPDELAAILAEVAAGSWPGPGAGVLARDHVVREHGLDSIGRRLAALYRDVASREAA